MIVRGRSTLNIQGLTVSHTGGRFACQNEKRQSGHADRHEKQLQPIKQCEHNPKIFASLLCFVDGLMGPSPSTGIPAEETISPPRRSAM